jgi:2-desacetyl-2-hydroxyethyl bacteriochlorophyllide A dehydrogenase
MKTIEFSTYGPPETLQIKEVEKPRPQDTDVLIKVHATTVSSGDVKLRSFDVGALYKVPLGLYMGFRKPKRQVLGDDFSGVVESVGKLVEIYRPGDRVFGTVGFAIGAHAEYVCLPEDGSYTHKPANMTHEEAAAIPFGGHTALYFLNKGDIRSGHKVLVYGASGSVGTHAVQIARHFGADVTGVCSTSNVELVKSLGADVIDYTKEDYTASGPYDVVYDTVGKSSYSGNMQVLKPRGTLILNAVFKFSWYVRALFSMFSSKRVITGVAAERREDMVFLKELAEAGKLTAVIDRVYPFEDIVEAHQYVDGGHKKGNVVILL